MKKLIPSKLQNQKSEIQNHLDPEDPLYKRALRELGIDRPVYYCKVVGSRLEFHLVGGDMDIVTWQPGSRNRVSSTNPVSGKGEV